MGYEAVAEGSVRQNFHASLFTLIDANKPSGWTVKAEMPNSPSEFPCIVMIPPKSDAMVVSTDKTLIHRDIKLDVDFWDSESNGNQRIDLGKDTVENTILQNPTTLRTYGLALKKGESVIDKENEPESFGQETFIVGGLSFMFRKIN